MELLRYLIISTRTTMAKFRKLTLKMTLPFSAGYISGSSCNQTSILMAMVTSLKRYCFPGLPSLFIDLLPAIGRPISLPVLLSRPLFIDHAACTSALGTPNQLKPQSNHLPAIQEFFKSFLYLAMNEKWINPPVRPQGESMWNHYKEFLAKLNESYQQKLNLFVASCRNSGFL